MSKSCFVTLGRIARMASLCAELKKYAARSGLRAWPCVLLA